jgi:hypothetical protein
MRRTIQGASEAARGSLVPPGKWPEDEHEHDFRKRLADLAAIVLITVASA